MNRGGFLRALGVAATRVVAVASVAPSASLIGYARGIGSASGIAGQSGSVGASMPALTAPRGVMLVVERGYNAWLAAWDVAL